MDKYLTYSMCSKRRKKCLLLFEFLPSFFPPNQSNYITNFKGNNFRNIYFANIWEKFSPSLKSVPKFNYCKKKKNSSEERFLWESYTN